MLGLALALSVRVALRVRLELRSGYVRVSTVFKAKENNFDF